MLQQVAKVANFVTQGVKKLKYTAPTCRVGSAEELGLKLGELNKLNGDIVQLSSVNKSKKLLSKLMYENVKNFDLPIMDWTPRGAKTFSHFKIGSETDPKYLKEVFSFYDKEKNIIGR